MQCTSCDDEMVREIVAIDVVIAGRRTSLDQPGWYCWACKIATHNAGDLSTVDDALAVLLGKRRPVRPGKAAMTRRG